MAWHFSMRLKDYGGWRVKVHVDDLNPLLPRFYLESDGDVSKEGPFEIAIGDKGWSQETVGQQIEELYRKRKPAV
jgi:hypothetical protein